MYLRKLFRGIVTAIIDTLRELRAINASLRGVRRPLSMLPNKPEASGWNYIVGGEPTAADVAEWEKRKTSELKAYAKYGDV